MANGHLTLILYGAKLYRLGIKVDRLTKRVETAAEKSGYSESGFIGLYKKLENAKKEFSGIEKSYSLIRDSLKTH